MLGFASFAWAGGVGRDSVGVLIGATAAGAGTFGDAVSGAPTLSLSRSGARAGDDDAVLAVAALPVAGTDADWLFALTGVSLAAAGVVAIVAGDGQR